CLVKFGPSILADSQQRLVARIYALLAMSKYLTHPLLLLLLMVHVPLIFLGYQPPAALLIFAIAGLGQTILLVLGQRELYTDWPGRLRYLPALLLVAVGLAPANVRAIFQAIFSRRHSFIRTPKGGDLLLQTSAAGPGPQLALLARPVPAYRLPVDWIVLVELLLAAYAGAGLALSLASGNLGPVFFMLTCTLGFAYVALASLRERLLPH
ncbi:MAG: hypothetical protein PVG33_08480, partial [Chloroflexota bacterium]